MTADSTSTSRHRAFVVALLLIPPLLSLLLIRIARTDPSSRIGARPAATITPPAFAAAKVESHPPVCIRLTPTSFGVVPGGSQELTAGLYWNGRGSDHFKWTTDGGALSPIGQSARRASLDAYVMTDDFSGDSLDPELWKAVVPEGVGVSVANGVLTLHDPGADGQPGGFRLETSQELRGDFGVEMTTIGAAALSVRIQDDIEPLIRRVEHGTLATIEAFAPLPDGTYARSTAFDPGGPAKLRIVRSGASVGYQVEVGGSAFQVGERENPGSTLPATVAISASAVDERPDVTAIVDNIAIAQNLSVVWHAPADARVGALYTIKTSDTCQATARIIRR